MKRWKRIALWSSCGLLSLALIILAAITLSAYAFWQAIDAYIEATGSTIVIAHEAQNVTRDGNVITVRKGKSSGLRLFGSYLIGAFLSVEAVSIDGNSGSALDHIPQFGAIRVLYIRKTKLTVKQLSDIAAACRRLQVVSFWSTGVDDQAVSQLTDLPEIQSISLMDEEAVSKKAICRLSDQASIRHLMLWNTPAIDKAEQCLSDFQLTSLTLAGRQFDDEAVAAASASGNLRSVQLFATGITDAVIEALAQNRHLRSIYITEAPVSRAAVEKLSRLSSLEMVVLRNTGVSPIEGDSLRAMMPQTQFSISGQ